SLVVSRARNPPGAGRGAPGQRLPDRARAYDAVSGALSHLPLEPAGFPRAEPVRPPRLLIAKARGDPTSLRPAARAHQTALPERRARPSAPRVPDGRGTRT